MRFAQKHNGCEVSAVLKPLAAAFNLGVTLRHVAYRKGWFKTQRLERPVVSVGNLSVGGTGKTPLVIYVARLLSGLGWKPSILTRGYGRRGGAETVALAPGREQVPEAREVGDEPALLAQTLPGVPIVVGQNRYKGGRQAELEFGVDVHLLDDGFQYLALARQIDVVLLDATQGLARCKLLPVGKYREPLSALGRAHLVVLTRTDLANSEPLDLRIREINPGVELFHAATKLCGFRNLRNGKMLSAEALRDKAMFAFCGIGNPDAFFANLREWKLNLVGTLTFRDHHAYRARDMTRIASAAHATGADFLVTTEKDVINFPLASNSDIPILSCLIQIEFHEADAFEEALMARLEATRVKV